MIIIMPDFYKGLEFFQDAARVAYTAIPYRASTGPEQGFPCVVNSHREKPVFIARNPCSHCRDPTNSKFCRKFIFWDELVDAMSKILWEMKM